MTADVLDYSWWRPAIADLKAAGIVSVSRYLSWLPNGKVIDKAEYDSLRAAGIGVILNWESTGTSYVGGYDSGKREGAEARRQARALGHPDERPIYQSVDTGVPPSQSLYDYQRGFNDGGGCGPQGFYGDAQCADALFVKGLIRMYWQTNARGWPGDSVDDPRANIIQRTSHSHANLPANQYDESDRKALDYGQNPAPPAPKPPMPPAVVSALKAIAAMALSLFRKPARAGETSKRVGVINALLTKHGYKVSGATYGPRTVDAIAHFKVAHKMSNHDGHYCGRPCFFQLLKSK